MLTDIDIVNCMRIFALSKQYKYINKTIQIK